MLASVPKDHQDMSVKSNVKIKNSQEDHFQLDLAVLQPLGSFRSHYTYISLNSDLS